MHEHFADWYRLTTTETRAEVLENRWLAIKKFNASISGREVLELVRLFFQIPAHNSETVERYKTEFKDTDAAFLMKNNDLELQVLAASSIMQILTEPPKAEIASIAALALVTGVCQGLRKEILLSDVIEKAHSYLLQQAIKIRELGNLASKKISRTDNAKFIRELKLAESGAAVSQLKEHLVTVFTSFQQTQNELVQNLTNIQKLSKLQSEETNIHWWLFGEYSRDLDLPFKVLEFPASCLILAKELADLTIFLPIAYSAKAFLSKALITASGEQLPNETDVLTTVKAVPDEWKVKIVEPNLKPFEDLCPVHYALCRISESSKSSQWLGIFEKQNKFKLKQNLPPVSLSLQFYYERMLIGSLNTK